MSSFSSPHYRSLSVSRLRYIMILSPHIYDYGGTLDAFC